MLATIFPVACRLTAEYYDIPHNFPRFYACFEPAIQSRRVKNLLLLQNKLGALDLSIGGGSYRFRI
jgi:hypothetical protein